MNWENYQEWLAENITELVFGPDVAFEREAANKYRLEGHEKVFRKFIDSCRLNSHYNSTDAENKKFFSADQINPRKKWQELFPDPTQTYFIINSGDNKKEELVSSEGFAALGRVYDQFFCEYPSLKFKKTAKKMNEIFLSDKEKYSFMCIFSGNPLLYLESEGLDLPTLKNTLTFFQTLENDDSTEETKKILINAIKFFETVERKNDKGENRNSTSPSILLLVIISAAQLLISGLNYWKSKDQKEKKLAS